MEEEEGWVYVLTNEAMPGLVKIGYTFREPSIRAEELYKDSNNKAVTGVPLPFDVAYKAWVITPYAVEQAVHKSLAPKRLNENREFFKCSPEEAIQHIRQVAKAKFEESKQEADRKLRLQKEQEERDTANRTKLEQERQRAAYEKNQNSELHQQLVREHEERVREQNKGGCFAELLRLVIFAILIIGILFQLRVCAAWIF